MTEADVIQPSASIASVGLGLRYIGNHCYAYSGQKNATYSSGADTTFIEFTSGAGYIVGKLSWSSVNQSSNVEFFQFFMNGEMIFDARFQHAEQATTEQPYELLIPPLSKVTFKMGIVNSPEATMTFTGRVYGAE